MGIGWPDVLALMTSVGFGALSAVFPLANAETYVVMSQVSTVAGAVPIAVGVSLGQTLGKLALFLGVRRGRHSRFAHRRRATLRTRPLSAARLRLHTAVHALLALVGTKRWGLPIVLLAAVLGIPPLYAVALLAGATRMRLLWFGLAVLLGRLVRFVVLVLFGGHSPHF